MGMTLADAWQFATAGARSSWRREASTDGDAARGTWSMSAEWAPVVLASYDQQTGGWTSNPSCYRLPVSEGPKREHCCRLMGSGCINRIDSPAAVRPALFPFEADAMTARIERARG
jgi:hypothetical protein